MTDSSAIPGARFVDPTVLARIGKLDLLARTVVDGFINGLHRAPYFGASIDFAEHRGYVPVSAKHFNVLLHTLDRAKPQRAGSLSGPVGKMAEHFKRRSVLALISDFYEEPDIILESIKPLRFLGNDLMVFHVLDPAEIEFSYDDASSFQDLESGEQIPVVPEALTEQYRALMQNHIDTLATKFSEHRIDYTMMQTSQPLDRALFSYLSNRERMMRVR